MSKPTTKMLVPKLRFPEFRDAGGWKKIDLGSIGKVSMCKRILKNETRPNGGIPFYKIGTFGKQADAYISREIYENFKSRYSYPKKGDILISASGTIGRLVVFDGAEAYFQDSNIVWIDNNESLVKNEFLVYCYENVEWATDDNTISRLYNDNLRRMTVLVTSIPEQQKIADCLSSVDELITAHNQKHEALKAHKKGLMQQLFPAEGETVPKLRFPEFQDAGEWDAESLGNQTKKVGSGRTPKGGDKNYKSEGRPFVRSQNIGWGQLILKDVAYIDEATHSTFPATEIEEGDVLLNITGASIGRCAIADLQIRGGNVNQHVCVIRTKLKKLNPFFLNQFILSNSGQRQIDSFQAGGNREGLNFSQIRSFSIPLPPETDEQQKIADCLSSIDNLITAHSQKHEALKAHKKGLMQQLFPAEGETACA